MILACPWNRILFFYLDLWFFIASYNNWNVAHPTFYPFTIKIKYLYASVCCGTHLGLSQDGCCLGLNSSVEPQASSSQNSITRKAGGRKEIEKEMQVSVFLLPLRSLSPDMHIRNFILLYLFFLFSGNSGHEGVYEQPSKYSPSEGHAHNTSNLGSRGLYYLTINMCREKEYPGSFYELHIRSPLPPSRDNGPLL